MNIYDKIKDLLDKEKQEAVDKYERHCFSADHNPPMHMVYGPGEHEHRCSACGHITKFSIPIYY